jgi:hypothetical protein
MAISEIDKKATITLLSLMLVVDNMEDLVKHEVYGKMFTHNVKNTARRLTEKYEKIINLVTEANDAGVEIGDSYVTFCNVIEDSFQFKSMKNEERTEDSDS